MAVPSLLARTGANDLILATKEKSVERFLERNIIPPLLLDIVLSGYGTWN